MQQSVWQNVFVKARKWNHYFAQIFKWVSYSWALTY